MKDFKFKKVIALLLSAAMIFSLAACSATEIESNESTTSDLLSYDEFTFDDFVIDDYTYAEPTTSSQTSSADRISSYNLRYVMIYNPGIYDEKSFNNSSLNTGYLGNQVDINASRGDMKDYKPILHTISQGDLISGSEPEIELSRGNFLSKIYHKGDTRNFYCFSSTMTRTEKTFRCAYVGKHCYIWLATNSNLNDSTLQTFGTEFDRNIFNQVVDTFGEPRFAGKTGKVNLLFSDLPISTLGCAYRLDMYSSSEISADSAKIGMYNTDHDILYINSLRASNPSSQSYMFSTMAHELQHQINYSNSMSASSLTWTRTWYNEAMSGYIEEKLYPGVQQKNNRYNDYMYSDLVRKGQSLYNFTTTDMDIGVYGSVFLFSRYLSTVADKNVFSNASEYWRNAYGTELTEAKALANSVPSYFKTKIDNLVEYPISWLFMSSAEKWMSKLTLDFYLSTLSNKDNIYEFNNINPEALLYDEINGANIEGGGRIIVAVKGNEFVIPNDAEKGLVYVGLDSNFNVIAPIICN